MTKYLTFFDLYTFNTAIINRRQYFTVCTMPYDIWPTAIIKDN